MTEGKENTALSPHRSIIVTLSVSVFLGISTTVVVAWILSTHPLRTTLDSRLGRRFGADGVPEIMVVRYERVGTLELRCLSGRLTVRGQEAAGDPASVVPPWALQELVPWPWTQPRPSDASDYLSRTMQVHGWPRPALWSLYEAVPNPVGYWGHEVLSGWSVVKDWEGFRPMWPGADPPVALPYRVAWGGFAIDTAFWSAAWAAAPTVPRSLRRALRRRRGRCPRCGYDLRGLSKCPECGLPGATPG